MSAVDDILFSPIKRANPKSSFVEEIWQALINSDLRVEFAVISQRPLSDYEQVAKLVDDDPRVFRKARNVVCLDNFGNHRPTGALTLKDVFARLRHNEPDFWWCCRRPAMTQGIEHYYFTNYFHIAGGCPSVGMSTGIFEPWVLGLLRKFLGYNAFYAFGSEQEAFNYWIS